MTHCYECDYHDHDGASGYCNKFETWTNMSFSCENDMNNANLIKTINTIKEIAVKANIKGFECLALDTALEAINKQISEKPKTVVEEYFGMGGKINKSYFDYCPDCNTSIDYEYDVIYCPKCGKKIDWSDEE